MLNSVEINCFDKVRHLRYDINSCSDLEKAGIYVLKFVQDCAIAAFEKNQDKIFELEGTNNLKLFLLHGLKHEDKSLTLDKIGIMIENALDNYSTDDIWKFVVEALMETKIVKKFIETKEKQFKEMQAVEETEDPNV